jgi:histidinol-phosphate aminotransferase
MAARVGDEGHDWRLQYANRYGYPDGGIVDEIAKHHGVKPENIMLGAGSGEILDVVGSTFANNGKKVVGVEPSYSQVYSHVTSVKGAAITIPLTADYRQDMSALIKITKKHYREVGFVYLCNPNNPTGRIVTKQEIKQLLDGLPEDMPVLIDEAYHHFVENGDYATSVPYVLEGVRSSSPAPSPRSPRSPACGSATPSRSARSFNRCVRSAPERSARS